MEAPTITTGLLSKTREGRFTASTIGQLMTTPKRTKEVLARIEAGEILFGETAMTCIAQKAWERLSGTTNSGPLTRATDRGNELEPVAFALLSQYWKPLQKNYADDGFLPYGMNSGATPDAYTDQGKATIDIKCPWNGEKILLFKNEVNDNDHEALKAWDGGYYWQIMLQMLAAGTDHGYLIYFDDRLSLVDADVTEYFGLPGTQFNVSKPGFAFVARRFDLDPYAKDVIDRVLDAAEIECQRFMALMQD